MIDVADLRERVDRRLSHALLGHDLDAVRSVRLGPAAWATVRECSVCGDRVLDVAVVDIASGERRVRRVDPEAVVVPDDLDGDDGGGSA